MKSPLIAFFVLLLSSLLLHPSSFGQGSLTPPGAPAPTMKSLDQIEARIPISSAPFTINASGSYYLTKNLSVTTGDAITINADRVTLDLNGFTISSTAGPAAGNGILLNGPRTNITIFNGIIAGGVTESGGTYSGTGFVNGINAGGPGNVRVSGVSVSGCLNYGINLSSTQASMVESCQTLTTGGDGIVAGTVSYCRVDAAGGNGITAGVVSNSSAVVTGNGAGISADESVENSYGQSPNGGGHTGTGIRCTLGTVINSSGAGDMGIHALTATNCAGNGASSPGISATTATNCRGFSDFNRGISADVVTGCYGVSFGGSFGINATYIAFASYGVSDTGTGLAAYIANSCRGDNSGGSSVLYTYHYNMPP